VDVPLREQVATLEKRLHEGYDIVENAKSSGEEADRVTAWEDFWLGLLADYEHKFDQLWGRK
jgi:hypothetical protein